jgi:hypothetical protein
MKRQQSIIDYVREDLDPAIWTLEDDDVKLRPEVKTQLIDTVMSALDDFDIPESAVKGLFVYGSLLTNQYNKKTDLDCRVLLYKEPVGKLYPGLTGDEIFDYLHTKLHDIPLDDSRHPLNVSIMIEGEDEADQVLARTKYDAVYDVLEDKFIHNPVIFPDEFDPQEEFKEERDQVEVVMDYLDSTLRDAKNKTIDYEVLEEAVHQVKHPEVLRRRLETKLQEIQADLSQLVEDYEQIKDERTKALTTNTEGNPHSEPGNVLYKYLERYQYLDILKKIKHIMKRGLEREEIPEVEKALGISK